MVVMTASEIVKQAKWLSNTTNSTLTDFYINSMLLSSIYAGLYADIVGNDNQFVQTFETSETVVDITDAFKILSITSGGVEVTRSTLRNNQTGGYYIENNKLYLPSGNKVIKYCPLPDTITCPDEYAPYTEEYSDYKMSNFGVDEEGNITESQSKIFNGEVIDFENIPEWMLRDDSSIVNVNVSDPYCFVSYADGKVRLYSSPDFYTDWNPFVSKSQNHEYEVVAFTSDVTTGKGVVFIDKRTNKTYYGSFVPDTVLSFPNNCVFDLLVKKLAAILASMVSIDNPYLTNVLLPEAETKFYQMLSKGSASRVNNVYGRSSK